MAAVARRSWADLKAEFLRRSGGLNYSGWSDRAEQFLKAAYVDICTLYSHHNLLRIGQYPNEAELNFLGGGGPYESLPDIVSLFGVAEYENTYYTPTRYLRRMTLSEYLSNPFETRTLTRPEAFFFGVVHGDSSAPESRIFFDVRAKDATRRYMVIYQGRPADPDISASDEYPEIGEEWDEHILEHALFKAGLAIGDQNLAATNASLFKDFVSQSGQKLLKESPTSQDEVKAGANRMTSHKVP